MKIKQFQLILIFLMPSASLLLASGKPDGEESAERDGALIFYAPYTETLRNIAGAEQSPSVLYGSPRPEITYQTAPMKNKKSLWVPGSDFNHPAVLYDDDSSNQFDTAEDDLSLSVWFFVGEHEEGIQGRQYLVVALQSKIHVYAVYLQNSRIHAYFHGKNGNTINFSTAEIADLSKRWIQLVVNFDRSGGSKIFLDGIEVASSDQIQQGGPYNVQSLRIAGGVPECSLRGHLSELALWKRCLTADEISQLQITPVVNVQ